MIRNLILIKKKAHLLIFSIIDRPNDINWIDVPNVNIMTNNNSEVITYCPLGLSADVPQDKRPLFFCFEGP